MRKKITSICLAAAILVMALAQTAFAANAQGSITATNVNVRSQPSVLSSKVMMLDKGDKVTVLGSRGEWYNISFEGKDGWVKDDFMNVREYLDNNILIFDGAMGTYFASKYKETYDKCELANIENSSLVYDIHREYIDAGCKAIKTNTFAANLS